MFRRQGANARAETSTRDKSPSGRRVVENVFNSDFRSQQGMEISSPAHAAAHFGLAAHIKRFIDESTPVSVKTRMIQEYIIIKALYKEARAKGADLPAKVDLLLVDMRDEIEEAEEIGDHLVIVRQYDENRFDGEVYVFTRDEAIYMIICSWAKGSYYGFACYPARCSRQY